MKKNVKHALRVQSLTRDFSSLKAANDAAYENYLNSPFVAKIRTPKGQIGSVRCNETAILSMGEKGVQLISVRFAPMNKV